MSAGDDLSGRFAPRARGRFAQVESTLTGAPQRPLEVVGAIDFAPTDPGRMAERADFLAFLDRRAVNAAAIEASSAATAETRAAAREVRQIVSSIREEISMGRHVGASIDG